MKTTPLKGKEIKKVIAIFVKEKVLLYHGILPMQIDYCEMSYEEKVWYCLNGGK